MAELTDKDVQAFMGRFKTVLIVAAIGVGLPLVALILYLDRRLDSFEHSLREPGAVEVGDSENVRVDFVQGQTVYVPAYSHIYFENNRPALLTITLSVRNTDPEHEIVLSSVQYYDTDGKVVRSLLERAVRVPAMATREFVIGRDDSAGGSGANFLVEWGAAQPVSEPIIETVMIDMRGQQSISFARTGKVIKEIAPSEPAEQAD